MYGATKDGKDDQSQKYEQEPCPYQQQQSEYYQHQQQYQEQSDGNASSCLGEAGTRRRHLLVTGIPLCVFGFVLLITGLLLFVLYAGYGPSHGGVSATGLVLMSLGAIGLFCGIVCVVLGLRAPQGQGDTEDHFLAVVAPAAPVQYFATGQWTVPSAAAYTPDGQVNMNYVAGPMVGTVHGNDQEAKDCVDSKV
jgi:hypothetical protein